ncbi:VanW family protein [Haloechinothrix halophila]|uniref:VanW family protein n=1 Tax=Haloechinothrix halophila TaxID=1069073 RepID=UPI000410F13E|nr:VanW family protein [Haloechinothrix halophila]
MADEEHYWPAWDSDKGSMSGQPSGQAETSSGDAQQHHNNTNGSGGGTQPAAGADQHGPWPGQHPEGLEGTEQATDAFQPVASQPTQHVTPPTPQVTPADDEPTVVGAAPVPPQGQPGPGAPAWQQYQGQYQGQPPGQYPPPAGLYGGAPQGLGGPDDPNQFATTTFADLAAQQEQPSGEKVRSGIGKTMMVAGAVMAALVLTYLADLLINWGDVPRGVTVAGVDVGGMSRTSAEQTLRQELQPRFDDPIKITAGDVQTELNPKSAGLGIDWQGTLEEAGKPPLSPITRITSFWTETEVGIVSQSIPERLENTVARLVENELNHPKVEGTIKFEPTGSGGDVEAVAVMPRQGQQVSSVEDAVATIESGWLNEGGVQLDVTRKPVKTSEEGVRATLEQVAEPAVSGPITMEGEGANGVLEPKVIGKAFQFKPDKDGSLKPKVDRKTLREALEPQLAGTETEGRDAEIVFEGGEPAVKPSKVGRQIDWQKSLKPYLDVITQTEERTLTAVYKEQKPKTTTEEAENLGIKEVIGEFTTGGFAEDSGVNIRTVAAEVNGAIVKPGDTFSLNGHTGKRGKAEGYVDAGIIENGVPGTAVGGGISQFATTLYNAAYFAGLKDAGHQEHSYYISRYPMAREATVFMYPDGQSVIDIAFTNDSPTGVAIQTFWTPDSVTVKIWGTKHYRVESKTGPKTDVTEAGTKKVKSADCSPSAGIDGFTVTDTRILYDIDTGAEVRREENTAVYNPKPEIVCTKDS